jgi:hypothetical protein
MTQLAIDFTAPYQRHSRTSRAAAERIEPKAGTKRAMVADAPCIPGNQLALQFLVAPAQSQVLHFFTGSVGRLECLRIG